jgi:hypothetical protein
MRTSGCARVRPVPSKLDAALIVVCAERAGMSRLVLVLVATVIVGTTLAGKRGRDGDDAAGLTAEDWDIEQSASKLQPLTCPAAYVELVVNLARRVATGELASTIGLLKKATFNNALVALRKAAEITDSMPTGLTERRKHLIELLVSKAPDLQTLHGPGQLVGSFVGAAAKVGARLATACKATNVQDLWSSVAPQVVVLKASCMRRDAAEAITTMVEDNIHSAAGDGTAYDPTADEHYLLRQFIAVAATSAFWVLIARFLDPRQCCRAPVLLAKTGLGYLVVPLNKALKAAGRKLSVDVSDATSLYSFIQRMLRHPASAVLLARFTDCLCFFAELRCNLVGLIGRSDKREAAKESREQTEAAHADCEWLRPQLELLFQAAAENPDAFDDAHVVLSTFVWAGDKAVATLEVSVSFGSWAHLQATRLRANSVSTPIAALLLLWAAALKDLLQSLSDDEAASTTDEHAKVQLEELRARLAAELYAAHSGTMSLSDALEHALRNVGLLHGLPLSIVVRQGSDAAVVDLLPTRRSQTARFVVHQMSFDKAHIVYTAVCNSAGQFVIGKVKV